MSSRNPKAVQAIQQFLRMQIRRQRTGDSLVTPKSPPARKHEAGKTAGKSGSAQ
ncbi:MAG TPA: hypothetical protein VKT32_05025 [Chthonomonadaceae bacterium]|nr:hypothetical protein [Chthonomonadaceae bacterium]